jgi:bacillithiol biosynthesis cysteine-adding enzyme BshC
MPNDCITYQNSGYFTQLIIDYLKEKESLQPLYNRFPKIENFKSQIEEKNSNYNDNLNDNSKREVLAAELEKQYQNFEVSKTTLNNIKLLNNSKTFTVTTGHQLNLFTGYLYFIYKIVSTINLCKQLKSEYPEYNFVPIYWMATEDHDFDEINYFNFKEKRIRWNRESSGPVGRLSTDGLDKVMEVFSKEIGNSSNAQKLKELFENAYLKNNNLADATRFLTNELFKNEGLVILDGDSVALKKLFSPYAKKELLEQTSFQNVTKTNELLKDYFVQVNPREINLFYIEDNLRERIILENGIYKINNTDLQFSENEIVAELEKHPEKFSPNVILRPLYEEVILPNLCYIGGGGELAYWFELKANFETNNVTFPILLLRNSVLLATNKQADKADKLDLTWKDLFTNQKELVNNQTKKKTDFEIDFSSQKEQLSKQFDYLHQLATQTDKSFIGAVKAQETKQLKGLDNLEKRLLKAQKRKLSEELNRIISLQNELFPNQSLQERQLNFSEFYIEFGDFLLEKILKELKPLENEFSILDL